MTSFFLLYSIFVVEYVDIQICQKQVNSFIITLLQAQVKTAMKPHSRDHAVPQTPVFSQPSSSACKHRIGGLGKI